jgi:hypothetical protein
MDLAAQVIELTMRQKKFYLASGAHGERSARQSAGDWDRLASQPRIISPDIETLCGVDTSAELLAKARDRVANVGFVVLVGSLQ